MDGDEAVVFEFGLSVRDFAPFCRTVLSLLGSLKAIKLFDVRVSGVSIKLLVIAVKLVGC